MFDHRPYRYTRGTDPRLDADLASAAVYEKVRAGKLALYWKSGLRWYYVPMDRVQRIYRRVEPVYGKLCCGGQSFLIEWLVLLLEDGKELVLHIGDNIVGSSVQKQAEALLEALKSSHPQIQYGKV